MHSKICIGVIADDLTGANDVGIQFFKAGFPVVTFPEKIRTIRQPSFVAVVNSDSRFNSASVAYRKVRRIAKFFKKNKIKRIYKKLDSTLRGNIGSEIDALIDEFNLLFVPVIPAFPEMKRTTLNGLHYVDGILLHKTEYAFDPKNPVKESFLPELIKSKYKVAHINKNIISKGVDSLLSEIKKLIKSKVRIISFDCQIAKEMDIIASALKSEKVVCGSAGLSGRLANYWMDSFPTQLRWVHGIAPTTLAVKSHSNILGIIGSVKETTKRQINFLNGHKNVIIKNYAFKAETNKNTRLKIISDILESLDKKNLFLYSAGKKILVKYAVQISEELGIITKKIIETSKINKLILSGGDIATKVCGNLGIKSMIILKEIFTGIPVTLGISKEKKFYIVTKPGGFGNKNALKVILNELRKYSFLIVMIYFAQKISICYSVEQEYKFYSTGYVPRSIHEVPKNTEIITIDEIDITGARNIGEVLEKHGFFVSQTGSYGSYSYATNRGFDKNDLLILLDGRVINDPKSGAIELNEVPLEIIDRIEIINGQCSSLYGAGAISSIINIITKDTPKSEITNMYGSYGTNNTQIYRIVAGKEFEGFQHLLAGNVSLTDGSRNNGNYDGKNLSGKFKYKFSDDIQVKMLGIYYNNNRNLPGKIDSPTLSANEKKDKGYLDLEFDSKISYSSGVKVKLYGNIEKYKSKNSNTAPENTDNISTLGINAVYNSEIGSINVITFGFNAHQDKLESSKIGSPQETIKAVFMQNQTNLLDFFYVDLGARFDNSSLFGSEFSPSLSVKYPFSMKTSIIGSVGRFFRTPTFEEISAYPRFNTEKGWNYEIGVEQIFSSGNLKTNLFRYDIDNFIYKTNQQVRASMDGVEISIEFLPFKGLRVGSIYTYTDPKNKYTDGVLEDTKKHSVDLNLTHKTDFGLITYIYGRYIETYNDVLLSGSWSKFGLKLTQNLSRIISVFVSADNILDKQYEIITGYPMSGREISAGAEIKF